MAGLYDTIRQNRPELQGIPDAQLAEMLTKRTEEVYGKPFSAKDKAEVYGVFGQGGSSLGDFGRGLVDGLNPLPDAVTRAILPKEAADWITHAGEAKAGHGFAHGAGELVGNLGSFMLPTGILGGLAKGGKILKGVDEAAKLKKIAGLTMGTQALLGGVQGWREQQRQGELYNDKDAGVMVPLMGAGLNAALNAVPAVNSMKAVLGLGGVAGGGFGAMNVAQRKAHGLDIGAPGDVLKEIGLGAAMGAGMGGVLHKGFSAVANRAEKRAAQAAAAAAPSSSTPPRAASAAPGAQSVTDAIRDFVDRGNRAPWQSDGADLAAFKESQAELNAVMDQLAAAKQELPLTEDFPARQAVFVQDLDGENPLWQVEADFRNAGNGRYTRIVHPDTGQRMVLPSDEILQRYHKQYRIPELQNVQTVIGPGYLAADPKYSITDTYKGRPVRIVGYSPNKTEVLVGFPDDLATFQTPHLVKAAEMVEGGELPTFYKQVVGDSKNGPAGIGRRQEKPKVPPLSIPDWIKAMLAELEETKRKKGPRP